MNDKGVKFNQNCKDVAFDEDHRRKMNLHYDLFKEKFAKCCEQYSNLELEKSRAFNIRSKAFKNLDKLLVDFETNFLNNGGKVLWACSSDEAKYQIYNILDTNSSKRVLKTKSITSEEINLTSFLEMKKIDVVETNFGDFICHLADEHQYNTQSPALHKNKKEVADLYSEKFGLKKDCTPKQLINATRKFLNNDFIQADAVITGANFLVSETGSIVLTEDEGNILKSITYAPIHIVLAGIDKVIGSIDDLNVLLPLSSFYDFNKSIANYYSFINRPADDGENVQQLYVIILNNDRTEVLEKERQRSMLSCIHCGACTNVCPIYNTVGGHVYENAMPGPVGSVIMPIIKGMDEASHFCSLCTLCGQCTEVCPMNIPIHDLILENRKDLIKIDKSLFGERLLFRLLMKKMRSRKNLDGYKSGFKNFELRQYIKKSWGLRREIPIFANQSFSEYWKEIKGINE